MRLSFRAGIHSGPVVSGLLYDFGKTPRYRLFGDTVRQAVQLSDESKRNCLLLTKTTADMVREDSKIKLIEAGSSSRSGNQMKTFWAVAES